MVNRKPVVKILPEITFCLFNKTGPLLVSTGESSANLLTGLTIYSLAPIFMLSTALETSSIIAVKTTVVLILADFILLRKLSSPSLKALISAITISNLFFQILKKTLTLF